MNYTKAKIEAQRLANTRRIDHVILYNGKEYSTTIAKKHKGEYFELVKPNVSYDLVEQPKKAKRVQKSENI